MFGHSILQLTYALLVLRTGLQSVYFRQEDIECPYTAPELWRTSEVYITISFIAWAIILLGYLAPFCFVAAVITHNGYSPSMNTNGSDDEGGSGNFGLFSAVYSANGAPPGTIDQMRGVSFEDFREDYPKECCVSYSLQHSNMGPIVCIIAIFSCYSLSNPSLVLNMIDMHERIFIR